jgi:hypothetical protein
MTRLDAQFKAHPMTALVRLHYNVGGFRVKFDEVDV